MEKAIQRHLEHIKTIKPNWETHLIGVFLYGSQNYNVHTENSDVDTKAIYVPTLDQLAFGNGKDSTTLYLDNDEHCELMTISHFVNNLLKQNINFMEVLFTDYCWINPRWEKEWMTMIQPRESIARYSVKQTVVSICGQALHTLKQYDGTDGKKVANSLRMENFLMKYLSRQNYLSCIKLEDSPLRDSILQLKQNLASPEYCLGIAESCKIMFEIYRDEYLNTHEEPNYVVKEWLHEQTKKFILKGIKEYEEKKF